MSLTVARRLAAASTGSGEGEGDLALPLVRHYVSARVLKRLVKQVEGFAELLLAQMRGSLARWATEGAAWLVLALLEAPATSAQVSKELLPALAEITASDADGCKTLSAAVKPLAGKLAAAPKKKKK